MSESKCDWEKVALRRAQFLLDEARSEQPTRDQTVTFALRVISNWATIGKDGSSSTVKWLNRNISQKAWELYHSQSDAEWEKSCINEHQEPISHVWQWILENHQMLTPRDILDRAKRWPMITVTKDEDLYLTQQGFRSKGSPEERHKMIVLGPEGPPQKRRQSRVTTEILE